MRSGPPSTLLLVLVLLVASAGATGAATEAPAAASDAALAQSDSFSRDGTVIEVQLRADGDARWTVTQRFNLTGANDTRAFERLAQEFEAGKLDGYVDTFRRASESASESTGRSMTVRNLSRDSTVVNGTGKLITTFTWTNFARVTGDAVRVDDAFNTTTGTWLPGLATDQRLVVRPPSGYRIDSAPSADSFRDGALVWVGPTDFRAGYLDITYRELQPAGTPNGTDSPPGTSPESPFDDRSTLFLAGGVLGVGVVAVGVYLFGRRGTSDGGVPEANGGTDTREPVADDPGAEAPPADSGAGAVTGEEPEPEAEEDDIDPELLSDEERVERLLGRNGGRMKQANIVKETGWSNAKVSQLLSAMDDDDRINKLRIGRENLISLPDQDLGEFEE